MASEAGVLPIPESKIVKKWRLQPGKMFLIDLEQGRIIDDKELKDQLAASKPYREWIERDPRQARRDRGAGQGRRARTARPARATDCSTASRRSATRRKTSSS